MTVGELIEKLRAFPPEMEVRCESEFLVPACYLESTGVVLVHDPEGDFVGIAVES